MLSLSRTPRRPLPGGLTLAALAVAGSSLTAPTSDRSDHVPPEPAHVSVVVRGEPSAGAEAIAAAVRASGGSVARPLGVINGVAAHVPAHRVAALQAAPGISAVTADGSVSLAPSSPLLTDSWEDPTAPPYDGDKDLGSLYHVTKAVGAHDVWSQHVTGKGVGVALIDSGVAPVTGMHGQVVNGPDLSFESQSDALRYLDSYGHGTHLAGIIAGRDPDVREGNEHDARKFVGVAPDAHVVSLKVATAGGAVDVSQILAAIDWAVQHRDDPALNIRVLNLSFGTDSTQDPRLDPLSYAVETAWKSGIVVVVSGGNDGGSTALRMPARNPYVLAVGAAHNNGTNSLDDDLVADFSNEGTPARRVDLVAPGKSIASLRTPGSASDLDFPGARAGDRFFRGSGTSQAAAVVSGAVALLLEHRPELTPDQVKDLLVRTAARMPNADLEGRGAGQLDVKRAKETPADVVTQSHAAAAGSGSLEASRGSEHVVDQDGQTLEGERDIFGKPWDAASWSAAAGAGTSWDGGSWNGSEWTGTCLCAEAWSAPSWSARRWGGQSWSGGSWSGQDWSARRWGARRWGAMSWGSSGWSS